MPRIRIVSFTGSAAAVLVALVLFGFGCGSPTDPGFTAPDGALGQSSKEPDGGRADSGLTSNGGVFEDAGWNSDSGVARNGNDGGNTEDSGHPVDAGKSVELLDTPSHIMSFLRDKTLTMSGAGIPQYPNGMNEDEYVGLASQCYHKVVIQVLGSSFDYVAQRASIHGADGGSLPLFGLGKCDHISNDSLSDLQVISTSVVISNVKGNAECFDIDINYSSSLSQEGRGSIIDGSVNLELYYKGRAVFDRCANGNPGSGSAMKLIGNIDGGVIAPFGGDSVQRYTVSSNALVLDSRNRILTFINGRTLTMEGANIPSFPNGVSEDLATSTESRCYRNRTLNAVGSSFRFTSQLGLVRSFDGGLAANGEFGICDHAGDGGIDTTETKAMIDYYTVDCFNVYFTFGDRRLEGRGSARQNGLNLEVFSAELQASNNSCVHGNPGSGGVSISPDGGHWVPFTGSAVQRYDISQ